MINEGSLCIHDTRFQTLRSVSLTLGGFVQTALILIKKITLQHFSSFSCYHFHNCASAMYEHPNKPDQENTVE